MRSKSSRPCSYSTSAFCDILQLQVQVTDLGGRNVLKTNFYQPTKVALSFRLAPEFLPEIEYPRKPHGMFIVIGNEFRGFHIRFRDVARGGIRIVMSRNRENYSINQRMLCVSHSFGSSHVAGLDFSTTGSMKTTVLRRLRL